MSLTSLCRICLESEAEISIFGIPHGEKNEKVITLLKTWTNIEITDIPGYPRSMCNQCNILIESAYELINKFIKANKILKSKISSIKQEKLNDSGDYEAEFEIEVVSKFKEESDSSKSDEDETLQDIKNHQLCKTEQTFQKEENITEMNLSKVKKELIRRKKKVLKNKSMKTLNKVDKHKKHSLSKKMKSKKKVEIEEKKEEAKKKPPEKSNLCEHCGLALKTKDSLAIHILKYHSEKLYCPECPYTNHSKKNLNMHIKRNHSEKTEKCSQCGNGFAILNDLKHHILKVHGKKREKKMYDCQYCDAKLARPYLKVIHERTAHTAFLSGLMNR